jgi:hypothetical protein
MHHKPGAPDEPNSPADLSHPDEALSRQVHCKQSHISVTTLIILAEHEWRAGRTLQAAVLVEQIFIEFDLINDKNA